MKATVKNSIAADALVAACLTFCLGIIAFSFQGSRGIWQPDEGYYTGTAVTMMDKGSALIPYLGEDEVFLDKPPMIYWGIIAGLKIFGHSEFGARFFHGLCFLLTSLTVGALSYSMFRDKWLGVLAALIYATMIVPFVAANFVTPDTILTLWTTLSLLCFWKSVSSEGRIRAVWQILLCAAVGLGLLAKGPAVLLPCGGIFVFLVVRRKMLRFFLTPWALAAILVFAVTGLSWYVWVSIKVTGASEYLFDNMILGRLVTEKYNRNPGLTGALIYMPILVLGSLPWSAIWLEKRGLLKSALLNGQWWKGLREKPATLLLMCCFLVPLLVLCAASSKLGLYALPLFVPLAIATARLWRRKVPILEVTGLRHTFRCLSQPVTLTTLWVLLLLLSRLGLAYYPTHDDMRTLWAHVSEHVPAERYELCTIDERADGLLFYGALEVEHLTDKQNPYPTFTRTENIIEELQEFVKEDECGIFLVTEEDDIAEAIGTLKRAGVECRVVRLPYHRAMLFPNLKGRMSLGKEKITEKKNVPS